MTLEAVVTGITQRGNWYRLKLENGGVAVGTSPSPPALGVKTQFVGEWHNDPKWGVQFKFTALLSESTKTTKSAVVNWLKLFKGIGEARANAIYDVFGEHTYQVLKDNPERLHEIPGVSDVIIQAIKNDFEKQQYLWAIHTNLAEHKIYELTDNQILKIFKQFEMRSIEVILTKPYQLTRIHGIGFKIADGIARKIARFNPTSKERLSGALFFTLREDANDGHTCSRFDHLIEDSADVLYECCDTVKVERYEELVKEQLLDLIRKDRVKKFGDYVYSLDMFDTEQYVLDRLKSIPQTSNMPISQATELANKARDLMEAAVGITLDETQTKAITQTMMSNFSIITGGPGTGKTSLLRSIVELGKEMGLTMSLCAPSGKASRRLSESTNHEAMTIHRMLGAVPPEEGQAPEFTFNKDNTLPTDLLICDEATMMDLSLFSNLLKALDPDTKIVLVGDVDQLPSVGPGSVFKDLIDSGRFSTIRLNTIYRQKAGSSIAQLSSDIKTGQRPDWDMLGDGVIKDEVTFVPVESAKDLPHTLVTEALRLLTMGYPPMEVQIILPQKVGRSGSIITNFYFQKALGRYEWSNGWKYQGPHVQIGFRKVPMDLQVPKDTSKLSTVELRQTVPREVLVGPGDIVRHTKNNRELEVFNGDVGIVEQVLPHERRILVRFPFLDEPVDYPPEYVSQLDLAFAVNAHVTQGSEYQAAVVAFHTTHYIMLVRNLAYTSVSRAKERLVVCGTKKALGIAIRNNEVAARNSLLASRLKKA